MFLLYQQDLCSSMCAVLHVMIIKYQFASCNQKVSPFRLVKRLDYRGFFCKGLINKNIGIHRITICKVKLLLQTVHPPERLAVHLLSLTVSCNWNQKEKNKFSFGVHNIENNQ